MRTIRVTLRFEVGGGTSSEVSTEVIVDDDEAADDAGAEAMRFLMDVSNGMGRVAS